MNGINYAKADRYRRLITSSPNGVIIHTTAGKVLLGKEFLKDTSTLEATLLNSALLEFGDYMIEIESICYLERISKDGKSNTGTGSEDTGAKGNSKNPETGSEGSTGGAGESKK